MGIAMIMLERGALPKRIAPNDITKLIDESLYWFCSTCRKWRTSKVKPDGSVTCSICEGTPDWKKHPPTLAYGSRFKRVTDLCAEGSEWRESYNQAVRQYGDYIDDIYAGSLPLRAKESGWRYFQGVWREVDKLADFLLTAQDAPETDIPYAYTEAGLQRRYQDNRRKHNIVTLSGLDLRPDDENNAQLSNEELAEIFSLRASHKAGRFRKGISSERFDQLCDVYFRDSFLDQIHDPLERSIACDLSKGFKKRDIERKYGMTERQVRTRVAHIAKALKNI